MTYKKTSMYHMYTKILMQLIYEMSIYGIYNTSITICIHETDCIYEMSIYSIYNSSSMKPINYNARVVYKILMHVN